MSAADPTQANNTQTTPAEGVSVSPSESTTASNTAIPAAEAAPAATAAAASSSASAADPASSSTTTPSPASAFKPRLKKIRKRTALKSSSTPLDDDEADGGGGGGGGGEDGSSSASDLQTIRLMQKLRSKNSSMLSLGEAALLHMDPGAPVSVGPSSVSEAAAAASGSSAAPSSSSSSGSGGGSSSSLLGGGGTEFGGGGGAEGKDAQTALIEEQMEKYIAEQMEARRALRQPQQKKEEENKASTPHLPLTEDHLFQTPAHLQIRSTRTTDEVEESGERWLTGIAEFQVPIKDKMANIEKTEAAKAKLMEQMRNRKDTSMVLPANFNANFRLHKKDWDSKRRDEFRAFHDAQLRAQALAQGLPVPPPSSSSHSGRREGSLPPGTDPNALPGFLAGPDEPRRDFMPRSGSSSSSASSSGYVSQRQSGVPNATDDRVVDRFIKRFKYK